MEVLKVLAFDGGVIFFRQERGESLPHNRLTVRTRDFIPASDYLQDGLLGQLRVDNQLVVLEDCDQETLAVRRDLIDFMPAAAHVLIAKVFGAGLI